MEHLSHLAHTEVALMFYRSVANGCNCEQATNVHVAKGTCRFRSVVLQDEEIGVLVLCQFGQVTCIGQWNHNMLKDSCEFADTAQTSPDHLNHACCGSSPLVDQFAARDL